MNRQAEALKARTRKFVLDVLALCKTIEFSPEGYVLRKQLAKAARGVAGNYQESVELMLIFSQSNRTALDSSIEFCLSAILPYCDSCRTSTASFSSCSIAFAA